MRVISIINQKGGVGKTTTALNVGHALALAGHRVLLIDLDHQAHLTDCLGLHAYEGDGVDTVLIDGGRVEDNSLALRDNLRLLPAGPRLGLFESENRTARGVARGWKLERAISAVADGGYEFVLIDCPPSAGLLTMNALMASSERMIPVASDYLSLHGLSRLMPILDHVDQTLKRSTQKWVVLTRFQRQRRLAREVRQKLYDYFPHSLMPTAIRENVSLAESPSYGQTIFEYKKRSYGAYDYLSLARNLLHSEVCESQPDVALCEASGGG